MIELLNANCYEYVKSIKDKSVNLIVTDPPYLIPQCAQGDTNKRTFKDMKHWDDIQGGGQELRDGLDLSLLDEFYRIQPFLNIYFFCNAKLLQVLMSYYLDKGFDSVEVLILHKTNPIPAFKGHYLPDMEYILYVCENKSSLNIDFESGGKLFSTSVSFERYTNHPTEKPLYVIEKLIENSSKEGDLVFDPFAGSGTTVHACKVLNRNFIGCEINKDYCEQSHFRLDNKVVGRLF